MKVYVATFKSTDSVPWGLRGERPRVGVFTLNDVVLQLSVAREVSVMSVIDLLGISEHSRDVEFIEMSSIIGPSLIVFNTIAISILLAIIASEPSLSSLGASDGTRHELLLFSMLLGVEFLINLNKFQIFGSIDGLYESSKFLLVAFKSNCKSSGDR